MESTGRLHGRTGMRDLVGEQYECSGPRSGSVCGEVQGDEHRGVRNRVGDERHGAEGGGMGAEGSTRGDEEGAQRSPHTPSYTAVHIVPQSKPDRSSSTS